jgi:hypothetical protein
MYITKSMYSGRGTTKRPLLILNSVTRTEHGIYVQYTARTIYVYNAYNIKKEKKKKSINQD